MFANVKGFITIKTQENVEKCLQRDNRNIKRATRSLLVPKIKQYAGVEASVSTVRRQIKSTFTRKKRLGYPRLPGLNLQKAHDVE